MAIGEYTDGWQVFRWHPRESKVKGRQQGVQSLAATVVNVHIFDASCQCRGSFNDTAWICLRDCHTTHQDNELDGLHEEATDQGFQILCR